MTALPAAAALEQPHARSASEFAVHATLCEGSCLRTEIIAGSSVTLISVYQRKDGRAQITDTRVRLMEKRKTGTWRPSQLHFLDWGKNPYAGWSPTLYPSVTTQYKFVLEPPCYEPGTTQAACKAIESSVITIVVSQASGTFRWAWVKQRIPVDRGEACLRGLLEQRGGNGKWSVNISSADVSVERREKGTWVSIDTFRLAEYGGFEHCVSASPSNVFRFVVKQVASKSIRVYRE